MRPRADLSASESGAYMKKLSSCIRKPVAQEKLRQGGLNRIPGTSGSNVISVSRAIGDRVSTISRYSSYSAIMTEPYESAPRTCRARVSISIKRGRLIQVRENHHPAPLPWNQDSRPVRRESNIIVNQRRSERRRTYWRHWLGR